MIRALGILLLLLLGAVTLLLLGVVGANAWVVLSARPALHDSVAEIPPRDVALVLGTVPHSEYLNHRIAAAAALYHGGKVRHLLLSGYRADQHYDEPAVMRAELIRRGIPAHHITTDPHGYRTLDSVIRALEVYGVRSCTIVSQRFHNPRALFIARRYGLDAVALNAADPPTDGIPRALTREIAARCAAFLDPYLLRTKPRTQSPPQPIPLPPT